MLIYLFRIIKKRVFSFLFSTIALAVAIASLIACLNIYTTLIEGKPVGTHYQGREVSLFSFSDSYNMSFTLHPRTLINLQKELGKAGNIIAASAGRYKEVVFDDKTLKSVIDTVSDNFFDVLKIEFMQGSAYEFSSKTQATCILSEKYLQRLKLTTPPASISVANKTYKVIAVTKKFQGLLDGETEVWIPWQHGHNILFPNLEDKGLLRQASLYHSVIISNGAISDQDFDTAIENLKKRTDLLFPPFNAYKTIKGISWSEEEHGNAIQSTHLYLYVSLLVFIVALLNLSSWVNLVRMAKLSNEITFLKLGISFKHYVFFIALLMLIPISFAFVLAYPLYQLYLSLLKQEPAIGDLFLNGTTFDSPDMMIMVFILFLVSVFVVICINWLIAKASSVGFFNNKTNSTNNRVFFIFRIVLFFASILTTMSLFFALFTSSYGLKAISMFKSNDKPIFFSYIHSSKERLNEHSLLSFFNSLKQENTELRDSGLIQYFPLNSIVKPDSFSFQEYTNPELSVVINPVTSNAMSILDITLKNGSSFDHSNNKQILVDENTAKEIMRLTGKKNIVGTTLYDSISDPYKIIGIVSNINYSNSPSSQVLVAYSSFDYSAKGAMAVLQGDMQINNLKESINQLQKQFGFKESNIGSYKDIIKKKRDPYISRLALSLSGSLVAIIISTLMLFSITNIDLKNKKQSLAIRACLGLSPYKLWWKANVQSLSIVVFGFLVGFVIFWKNSSFDAIKIIIDSKLWVTISLMSFFLIFVLAGASIMIAFRQIFTKQSLYSHLKSKD